jgi:hypothetical protein
VPGGIALLARSCPAGTVNSSLHQQHPIATSRTRYESICRVRLGPRACARPAPNLSGSGRLRRPHFKRVTRSARIRARRVPKSVRCFASREMEISAKSLMPRDQDRVAGRQQIKNQRK